MLNILLIFVLNWKMETLNGNAYSDPFPHLVIKNFYNEEELELIWEELVFLSLIHI